MKRGVFLLAIILMIFAGSCKRLKKTDAEIEREHWISGFSDSVEYYQHRSREVETRLTEINGRLNQSLQDFEFIKNPREVSGYYLLKGWKSKIPFTTTAIYARVNENHNLELIATLAGATFNKIGVGNGASEFYSETVPHDQAFNFRHERFNTVYFEGGKADTIAEYISLNKAGKVTLEFLETKRKKLFMIPQDEKDMISQTWDLYSLQTAARDLQKELWINSRKIETFRRMMDTENKLEEN
ncbi:MAG: hypothetical protein J1F12_00035 [Muribaculaceae bacterium]|nr:hypothetical protein [Muribaculaceae bacterium]